MANCFGLAPRIEDTSGWQVDEIFDKGKNWWDQGINFLIRRKRNGFVPDPRLTFSRARCRLVSPLRRQPHPSCQPQACRPHLKSVLMYWTGAI
jgi:hypothetical protein